MLTLAIFIASIVAYGFVTYVNHGWQYIQVSFEWFRQDLYFILLLPGLCSYSSSVHVIIQGLRSRVAEVASFTEGRWIHR